MVSFKHKYILIVIFLITILSCDKIKGKSHETINKSKQKIAEEKSALGDKIITHYDPYHPDTKFNKKRFSEFFLFNPTPDVKNIYCYADEMGIDHKYQFSFNCDVTTINKIISNLHLKSGIVDDNNGNDLWQDFSWWDSLKIKKLKPFSKKGNHEAYWYLWYDTLNTKAYYFSFDM
jgi:hypothetical protein